MRLVAWTAGSSAVGQHHTPGSVGQRFEDVFEVELCLDESFLVLEHPLPICAVRPSGSFKYDRGRFRHNDGVPPQVGQALLHAKKPCGFSRA